LAGADAQQVAFLRGIVAAGALLDARIRDRAYAEKPPELLARLRSTDVLLLSGADDKNVRPEAVRNLSAWLKSYNPEGVQSQVTPKVAKRYDAKWTTRILDWITRLRAAPGGKRAPRGEPRR